MRNTVIAAAFGAFVLSGCSSTAPAPSPSAESSVLAASSAPASSRVPTPDASQRAGYLAALRAIDPLLVVNEERAIRRGRAVCDRVIHGSGGSTWTLEKYTVEELSGGTTTIDEDQAKQVIKAVKVWCRA
ncbi:DUF732 domain-containing protein [Nonomuraea sp. NPDC003560]|uniref:DUF732 domain-containing protein n=1 Tax=Nonomuraea sp. NPDC003560 TaxID=3364341 RepID=UPI00369EDA1E